MDKTTTQIDSPPNHGEEEGAGDDDGARQGRRS